MWQYLQISVSNTDILIRSTNSPFFQFKKSNHRLLFFDLYFYSTNSFSDMNATLVSNPQNHNRNKKICQLYNIDFWNSYEWLCWRSLWKWYFTLHSMNYLSWVFLQESKVSCSRAKPTRLSFSFLWIHVWNCKKDGTRVKPERNNDGWFDYS